MRASFTLGHLSDTHLGYEAYPILSPRGNNQRGEDIVRAFSNSCRDIAADPGLPLALHTGDVGDRPVIPVRYMLAVRSELQRLTRVREDGTRRQVVVIAGNHDLPRSPKEPCYLEMYAGIPGVHIVTQSYTQIDMGPLVAAGEADPSLADVIIHALPHDELKRVEFDIVAPVPGKTNILMAHGVAGGSELYVRTIGREYAIPTDVLGRDWDYVALGHWHKQGPVGLLANKETAESKIWYAGSTENVSFRDLRDNGTERGYLKVQINPDKMPAVKPVNLPIRTMMRLPVLDAEGLGAEQIVAELKRRIAEAEGITGAVVGQKVINANRDLWSITDLSIPRTAASHTLHYEIQTSYATAPTDLATASMPALGDLGSVLEQRSVALLAPAERDAALALARKLLGSALDTPVGEGASSAESDGSSDEASPASADAPVDSANAEPAPAPADSDSADSDSNPETAPITQEQK